jgi:branched-chain amino acid aminotransferase
MNLFAVFKTAEGGVELATPPLGDTILAGVTRDA